MHALPPGPAPYLMAYITVITSAVAVRRGNLSQGARTPFRISTKRPCAVGRRYSQPTYLLVVKRPS